MSKTPARPRQRHTIFPWIIITGVIVGTVIYHSGNPAPAPFDLLSLGLILQNVTLLVRHRRPKLATLLTAINGAVLILFFILFFLQRQ